MSIFIPGLLGGLEINATRLTGAITGYVLGLVIESAIKHQEASTHPDPIHVTAHFLKSAMVGPYEVHLRDLKVGRDFKHISAAFVQNVGQVLPPTATARDINSRPL